MKLFHENTLHSLETPTRACWCNRQAQKIQRQVDGKAQTRTKGVHLSRFGA